MLDVYSAKYCYFSFSFYSFFLLYWQLQLYYTYQVLENTKFQKRWVKATFRKIQANSKTRVRKHCKYFFSLTRGTQSVSIILCQIPPLCNLGFFLEIECKLPQLAFQQFSYFCINMALLRLSPALVIWLPLGMSLYNIVTKKIISFYSRKMWMQITSILYFFFFFSAYIWKLGKKASTADQHCK